MAKRTATPLGLSTDRFNRSDYEARKAQRTAAKNAIARLQQIEDHIEGSSAAQTQTAIKDLANYMQHIIRILVE